MTAKQRVQWLAAIGERGVTSRGVMRTSEGKTLASSGRICVICPTSPQDVTYPVQEIPQALRAFAELQLGPVMLGMQELTTCENCKGLGQTYCDYCGMPSPCEECLGQGQGNQFADVLRGEEIPVLLLGADCNARCLAVALWGVSGPCRVERIDLLEPPGWFPIFRFVGEDWEALVCGCEKSVRRDYPVVPETVWTNEGGNHADLSSRDCGDGRSTA